MDKPINETPATIYFYFALKNSMYKNNFTITQKLKENMLYVILVAGVSITEIRK